MDSFPQYHIRLFPDQYDTRMCICITGIQAQISRCNWPACGYHLLLAARAISYLSYGLQKCPDKTGALVRTLIVGYCRISSRFGPSVLVAANTVKSVHQCSRITSICGTMEYYVTKDNNNRDSDRSQFLKPKICGKMDESSENLPSYQ